MSLGFEQAGIKSLAYVEINHDACDTLRSNRPEWNVIEDDIYNVSFHSYKGKVDLVSGGVPCQAFSYAGKRKGLEDDRGILFEEFSRAVQEINPSMFLFENVYGLLTHDKGQTFNIIRSNFYSLGYDILYQVMDASYYGVGQKRKRLIVVGIKKSLDIDFRFPEPEPRQTTLREALKDVPKSIGMEYSEKKKELLKLVPPGGCWVDLPREMAMEYMGNGFFAKGGNRGYLKRLSWEEPCTTLTTSPCQKQTEKCHPDEIRPLTVREYARIQSFPDSWEFKGNMASQYRQIGNAVPVEFARRLGISIKKALDKLPKKD